MFGPNFNIFADSFFEDMDCSNGQSGAQFGQPFGMGMGGNSFFSMTGGPQGHRGHSLKRQKPPVEYDLKLNLEELYTGCHKKMKITRQRIRNGTRRSESKVLEINIKPGWKAGTKITFSGDGDEDEHHSAGDVIFKVCEKPHSVFERVGNDLVYTHKLPLRDVSLSIDSYEIIAHYRSAVCI